MEKINWTDHVRNKEVMRNQGGEECCIYEGNSISKLQIQVATYVFELSAGNCHR